MIKTLRFALVVEVSIDGPCPDDETLTERVIATMYEHFPSVLLDDDEMDCTVFVNYCEYTNTAR